MKPIIVVPNYIITEELRELATTALKSMRATADICIVSVDDGSPLDTGFLGPLSDHVIRMHHNVGFAKACNTGLRWALRHKAGYIGCANNDIEVFPGWLEALVEPFEKFEEVGITGLVASKDRDEAARSRGRKITQGGLLDHHMQAGGLWLSTKPVLKLVGLFDERFEIGGEEDVDLFMRMHDQHGLKIIMSDKSMFWHKEGATRWNTEVDGFKERNKAIEQGNYDRYAAKWGYDIRERGIPFYEEILEE